MAGKGSQTLRTYQPTPPPSLGLGLGPISETWSAGEFDKIAQSLGATQEGFRVSVLPITGATTANVPEGEFRAFLDTTVPGLKLVANMGGIIYSIP